MRRRYLITFVAAGISALISLIVSGQSQEQPRQPDVQHGAVIVAQGTAAGAPACAQCHAFDGVSDASGAFPRLAGQSHQYLAQQLHEFASGERANAIMSPVAMALSPDDIADVTAYYAEVDGPYLPLKPPDPELVKLGEKLAIVGDERRQLQSCNNCHGPGGVGEPPAIPYLAGQYKNYIAFALREWQRGYRKGSTNEMAQVAGKLNDHEIAAVAAYFQQVVLPLGIAEAQPKEQK